MMANGFFVFRWRHIPAVLASAVVDRRASAGAGILKRDDDQGTAFRGLALVALGFSLQLIGLLITLYAVVRQAS